MSKGFHNKYRPQTLDEIVGNTKAVTQLRGFIKSGNFPSGILFTGPSGVGKTTMARAFVNDVLGDGDIVSNCLELNFGENRSIEEVRALIQHSKLRPANGAKRRFIIGDEAQQLLSNVPAANAFLKPLEEPVSTTTFLLCSMDPDKFASTQTGKAIARRCVPVVLSLPSDEELQVQAKRILKGEKMTRYVGQDLLDAIVTSANRSMSNLANNLELLSSYYSGLDKKPEALTEEDLAEVLGEGDVNQDVLAARCLLAVYARKYVAAHKEILNITDGFAFISKLLNMNWFVQNQVILKGAKHPKIWSNTHGWNLWKETTKLFDGGESPLSRERQIEILTTVHYNLVGLKFGSGAFAVDERMAISSALWNTITQLKTLVRDSQ